MDYSELKPTAVEENSESTTGPKKARRKSRQSRIPTFASSLARSFVSALQGPRECNGGDKWNSQCGFLWGSSRVWGLLS